MLTQVQSEIEAIKAVLASMRHSHHSEAEREQHLYELSNHNHAILVYMGFTEEKLHEMLIELQKKENHILATEAYQNSSGLSAAIPTHHHGESKGSEPVHQSTTTGAHTCWSNLINITNVRGMRKKFVKFAHDYNFKGFANRISRDCVQIRIVFPDPTNNPEVEERIFKFFDYFKRHYSYEEVEEGKVTTNFVHFLAMPFSARMVSVRILHAMEKHEWSDDVDDEETHTHYDHLHHSRK